MLKLPRTSLSPEELIAVEAFFTSDLRPVCEGSTALISHCPFAEHIQASLRTVMRTRCTTQGLELITRLLEDEKKGLLEVQRRTAKPAAERMSRLLFTSNDGSERFYHHVDGILSEHGNRVWCVRLEVSADVLGRLVGAQAKPVKAIMINDKKALASFLTELSRSISKAD